MSTGQISQRDFAFPGMMTEGRPSDFDDSLGVIPVEDMSDLDGVLRLDSLGGRQDDSLTTVSSLGNKQWSKNFPGIAEILPSKAQVNLDSPTGSRMLPDGEMFDVPSRDSTFGKPVATSQVQGGSGKPPPAPVANPHSEILLGAFAGLGDEPDASFHEVCFEADELEQFDEDFSDLEDSDGTVIEDPPGPDDMFVGARLEDVSMPFLMENSGFEPMLDAYCSLQPDQDSSQQQSKSETLDEANRGNANQLQHGATLMHKASEDTNSSRGTLEAFDDGCENFPRRQSSLFGKMTSAGTSYGNPGEELCARSSDIFGDTQGPDHYPSRPSDIFGTLQVPAGEGSGRTSDIFGGMTIPAQASWKKSVVAEENLKDSPVYINENGEGVTDLAYRVSLSKVADNPFSDGGQEASEDDDMGFDNESFLPAEEMLDKLADDEANFEAENIFRNDEEIVTATPETTFSQDSWGYRSALLMSGPSPADHSTSFAPYMRISIGAFMSERTEVLGTLTGDKNTPRPTFGSKIVTPPGNRQPQALFDRSVVHVSPDAETDARGTKQAASTSQAHKEVCEELDAQDQSSLAHSDRTLTTDDLAALSPPVTVQTADPRSHKGLPHVPVLNFIKEVDEEDGPAPKTASNGSLMQEASSQDTQIVPSLGSDRPSIDHKLSDLSDFCSRSPSPSLESSDINLSTIAKLVTGELAEEDIVGAIMRASQAKGSQKQSRERRKAMLEADRMSSDSSDVELVTAAQGKLNAGSRNGANPKATIVNSGKMNTDRPAQNRESARGSNASAGRRSISNKQPSYGSGPCEKSSERRSEKPQAVNRHSGQGSDKCSNNEGSKRLSRGSGKHHSGVMRGIPKPGHHSAGAAARHNKADPPRSSVGSTKTFDTQRSSGSSEGSSKRNSSSAAELRQASKLGIAKISSKRKSLNDSAPKRNSMTAPKSSSFPVEEPGKSMQKPSAPPGSQPGQNANQPEASPDDAKEAIAQWHMMKRKEKLDAEKLKAQDSHSEHEPEHVSRTEPGAREPPAAQRQQRAGQSETSPDDAKEAIAQWHSKKRKEKLDAERSNTPENQSDQHQAPSRSGPNARDLEPRWKSPRPSSVFSRSKYDKSQLDVPLRRSKTPYEDPDQTPVKRGTVAPRRVQFQPASEQPVRHHQDELLASQDITPTNQKGQLEAVGLKWLSSTPKVVASDSIHLDVHEASTIFSSPDTGRASQGENKDEFSSVGEKSQLVGTHGQSHLTQVELSQPSLTFASQYLASSTNSDVDFTLKCSTGRGFALDRDQQPGDGVFKVPELPAKKVPISNDDRLSMPYQTTLQVPEFTCPDFTMGACKGEMQPFPGHMIEVRESLPGPPSIHSTPQHGSQHGVTTCRDRQSYTPDIIASGLPSVGIPQIQAPREARIPGVCCVGLSTQGSIHVRSTSSRWLHVHIQRISLGIDGQDCNHDLSTPFVLKEKFVLEPGKSEDVKVVFVPRQAGAYMAKYRLDVSPVATNQALSDAERIPTVVTVLAVCEKPTIQIVTGGTSNLLDFGTLPWGCHKALPVTLINRGRATIPIRLVITTTKSAWNCFTFEKSGSSDVSLISNESRPATLAPTLENFVLRGSENDSEMSPIQTVIYFKAPSRLTDRGAVSIPPEELSARVLVEVDTPSKYCTIGQIDLVATVGTARLHTLMNMEQVDLKTMVGQCASQVIPLLNAGNIPIEVSLEVTHWPDFYTVLPMMTTLQPGQQSEVIVKFQPKQGVVVSTFHSLLLMLVEPDGPGYEIPLMGEVIPSSPAPISLAIPKAPPLLSNKHYLAWGGVPMGKSLIQKLTLKNPAEDISKLILQVVGDTTEFQLQSTLGERVRLMTRKEIILRPLEEYIVQVTYTPAHDRAASAKLYVKQSNLIMKYAIPLTGYCSEVELNLDGLTQNKKGYCWVNMGHLVSQTPTVTHITVQNLGKRPAYVKALSFHDIACKRKLPAGRVTIDPPEFCLKENSSVEVTVVMVPTHVETSLCQKQVGIVANVAFFYGDELSRQLYKINRRRRNKPLQFADDHPLKGVNFDTVYHGEEAIAEVFDVKPSPADAELFYSQIMRRTFSLVGSPAPVPCMASPVPPTPGQTLLTVAEGTKPECSLSEHSGSSRSSCSPNYSIHMSPPERGARRVTSNSDIEEMEWWTVRPQQLVLYATKEAPAIQKLQLTNYKDEKMRFDVQWPQNYVTVTPESGAIPPRNFAIVCVSAKPNLLQTGVHLPCEAHISVNCSGQTKDISVKVRDYLRSEMPDSQWLPTMTTSLPSLVQPSNLLDKVTMSNSLPSQPKTGPKLSVTVVKTKEDNSVKVLQERLEFPSAFVKSKSEEKFEIRNVEAQSVKWSLNSFTPPYLKSPDGSGNVTRVPYSVFYMPASNGILKADQVIQIPVHFQPQEPGQFMQCLEIKSVVIDNGQVEQSDSFVCTLELVGQAIPNPIQKVPSIESRISQSNVKSQDRMIIIEPTMLSFCDASVNISQKKVKIRNRSSEDEKLLVLPLEKPFTLKYRYGTIAIKSQHYLKLPIEFCAMHPGNYTSLLQFRRDSGELICIQLTGNAR